VSSITPPTIPPTPAAVSILCSATNRPTRNPHCPAHASITTGVEHHAGQNIESVTHPHANACLLPISKCRVRTSRCFRTAPFRTLGYTARQLWEAGLTISEDNLKIDPLAEVGLAWCTAFPHRSMCCRRCSLYKYLISQNSCAFN